MKKRNNQEVFSKILELDKQDVANLTETDMRNLQGGYVPPESDNCDISFTTSCCCYD